MAEKLTKNQIAAGLERCNYFIAELQSYSALSKFLGYDIQPIIDGLEVIRGELLHKGAIDAHLTSTLIPLHFKDKGDSEELANAITHLVSTGHKRFTSVLEAPEWLERENERQRREADRVRREAAASKKLEDAAKAVEKEKADPLARLRTVEAKLAELQK